MAFCKQCGKEISENLEICEECSKAKNASTQKSNDSVESAKNAVEKLLDTKDTTDSYTADEIEKNKVICALAYVSILFWLPLVAGPKDSKYCKFHANQGLLLFILGAVFAVASTIIGIIPIVGFIIVTLVGTLTSLIELGLFLFGFINTITGKSKELPLIGNIRIIND